VRVYCGLASAGERLTAAVVDDCGQVAALHQVGDDPQGYAELLSLLCQRADPAGIASVPFASDSPGRPVLQLLVASGRTTCFVDEATVARLASAEPPNAAEDAKHAVAMARALYSGQLAAAAQPSPPQLAPLRPVLAAHTALAISRTAAVAALREVLRELYPAALRAFPDPAAPTPLAVLDALPEPGQLGLDGEGVVPRLVTAGFSDAAPAIAELRRAVDEDADARPPVASVSATVRQAVAAVLACDTAVGALLRDITEQLAHAGVVDAAAPQPAATPDEADHSGGWALTTAPKLFGAPPPADPVVPRPVPRSRRRRAGREQPAPAAADTASTMPLSADDRTIRLRPGKDAGAPAARIDGGSGFGPPDDATAEQPALATNPRYGGAPDRPSLGEPDQPVLSGDPELAAIGGFPPEAEAAELPTRPTEPERPVLPGEPDPPQLDFSTDFQPTVIMDEDAPETPAASEGIGGFDADDETPAIRDLGPVPRPPLLRSVGGSVGGPDDELSGEYPLGSVTPLPEPSPRPRRGELGARSRRRNRSGGHDLPRPERRAVDLPSDPMGDPAMDDESDSELLIFAAARSAWFAGDHGDLEWDTLADEGWRAAEAAAQPAVGTSTESGLPRRVPQANLVPGSPVADEPERAPISRDASQLAAQTAGYFRGWQRGRRSTGHEPTTPDESEAFTPAGRQ
jgi:transposase